MEGKKSSVSHSPSSSSTSTSTLVEDLFGGRNSVPSGNSSSSGLFHSVFPPPSKGRDSSRSDIFGPSRKQGAEGQAWNSQNVTADGISQGSWSKGDSIFNKDQNSVYQEEKIEPCYLSSSLYYGGQDICTRPASSRTPTYNYKKDGEDDSNSSNVASRGNWWQGSLYY